MELEFRTDDNYRTAGVVDALAEQVLPEPALLSFSMSESDFSGRLEAPAIGRPRRLLSNRASTDSQHPLLIADDDLRRAQLDEPLQSVVTVDHPTVQIVQIGGRESSAIEWDQRPQLRRNDRNDLHDHPLRTGAGFDERLDQFETLHQLLALGSELVSLSSARKLHLLGIQIDRLQHVADRLGADADGERILPIAVDRLLVLLLGDQFVQLERREAGFDDHVALEVQDFF